MLKKKTDKDFDCIALKRRAHERINRETDGMTPRQEAEYFRKAAESGPLARWWKSLQVDAAAAPPARRARSRAT